MPSRRLRKAWKLWISTIKESWNSLLIILIIAISLLLLYGLSTAGRTGHRGLRKLQGWAYAHRGLHGDGVPENSVEAFRRAKKAGYGVELDIHLLADGNLAVIHDSRLNRTTGQNGVIEDLITEQLNHYCLEGTSETIPQFREVLELFKGEVPLIVELKCERNNYAALCDAACKMLDSYAGPFCMESFDPRCVYWLRRNRPDIIRGQLTENYFSSPSSKLPWYLKFVLKNQMLNFLTLPDFVAYRYKDRKTISNVLCKRLWGVMGVSWTLKDPQEYDTALSEGWLPIFEGFKP